MKTNLIFLSLLILTASIQAQNLEQYISNDATAVVEIDGGQIFSLISMADLEAMLPPDPSGEPTDLTQYGINVKTKAYYFYQDRGTIGYNNIVLSLTDPTKAEELIKSMIPTEPTEVNGFNFAIQDNMTAAWNNTTAILTKVDFPKKVYTMEDLLAEKEAERLANEAEESEGSEEEQTAGEDVYGTETEDDYTIDTEDEYGMDTDEEYPSEENLEFELMIKNMDAPSIYSEEEMTSMLSDNFHSILNTNPNQSIRQVSSYNNGKKSNSSLYFWVKNMDEMIKDAMPENLFAMLPGVSSGSQGMPTGMTEITSNIIFNQNEIRWESNFGIDPSIAEAYSRIYKTKMDKSFLNHFDQDDVLSYLSFSTDISKSLEEYPAIMQSIYGSYFPEFYDEIGVGLDLLEVILDEEAIGELITGDALMVLHNVDSHEVTYTTTEYDADFNPTEVEKTKMEPLPIFSVMLGSENKKIIGKLMKLARKHKVAEIQGKHHRISSKDMGAPFDMYFTQNDGIVYLTNSPKKISNYASGKKTRKPGKHKKLLRNNALNFYVNSSATLESLSDLLPLDPNTVENIKSNYKEIYLTSSKIVDNKMDFDFVLKTSGAQGNSLKLILDSMNSSMKGI